jgi:hypothetical protein
MYSTERYIDEIVRAARLAPADERRLRREVTDHLREMCSAMRADGVADDEIEARVRREFGDPSQLGPMIASAKGRLRTCLKKNAAAFSVASMIMAVVVLLVRTALAAGV